MKNREPTNTWSPFVGTYCWAALKPGLLGDSARAPSVLFSKRDAALASIFVSLSPQAGNARTHVASAVTIDRSVVFMVVERYFDSAVAIRIEYPE